MISRDLKSALIEGANTYPVVTLTGPRQSGKTTLVKEIFSDAYYYNLEDPSLLQEVKANPKLFVENRDKTVIFDEIQNYPELLSYIQVTVDEVQENCMFIITGSQHFSLLNNVTQSLAGRTSVLTLYPLTLSEVKSKQPNYTVEDWIIKGFLPRIHSNKAPVKPEDFYRNYVYTYLERDIRTISTIKNLENFRDFIALCAGRVGQLVNIDDLCNSLGIDRLTVKHWLNLLETSYIIKTIKPYHNNFGKRIIKTPKIYFVDTGIVCYLLNIRTTEHLKTHPLKGQIFENMMVMDIVKNRVNYGFMSDLFFYRDNKQKEVDLILEVANDLYPIEIKSSSNFSRDFLSSVNYFKKISNKVKHAYLIYTGTPAITNNNNVKTETSIFNYKDIGDEIKNIK